MDQLRTRRLLVAVGGPDLTAVGSDQLNQARLVTAAAMGRCRIATVTGQPQCHLPAAATFATAAARGERV